jgi:hypothetical protein
MEIQAFRRELRKHWGIPVKMEFHSRPFLLGKHPYKRFELDDRSKLSALEEFVIFISTLEFKTINVAINKLRIKSPQYKVLDRALTYNIQRIENDLSSVNENTKFMAIVDEGRIRKMRTTARRLQRINFIPSKYSEESYRREIKTLIEDPLPKPSEESYFIQICDLISFLVFLYVTKVINNRNWRSRLEKFLTLDFVLGQLERLKPVLNLKAAPGNEFGIVIYPK